MPKRVSERTHAINYAMSCTEEEINLLLETVRAIAANRFPRAKGQAAKPKKKAAKGVGTQTSIEDILEDDTPPKKANGKGDKFVPDPAVMRMIEESKAERGEEAGAS